MVIILEVVVTIPDFMKVLKLKLVKQISVKKDPMNGLK